MKKFLSKKKILKINVKIFQEKLGKIYYRNYSWSIKLFLFGYMGKKKNFLITEIRLKKKWSMEKRRKIREWKKESSESSFLVLDSRSTTLEHFFPSSFIHMHKFNHLYMHVYLGATHVTPNSRSSSRKKRKSETERDTQFFFLFFFTPSLVASVSRWIRSVNI